MKWSRKQGSRGRALQWAKMGKVRSQPLAGAIY